MVVENKNIIIENIVEKKLIYRALVDLRMNDKNCEKYYSVLDDLIYNLKHHICSVGSSRFLF